MNNRLNSNAYATIEGNFETIYVNNENSKSSKTQLIKGLKINPKKFCIYLTYCYHYHYLFQKIDYHLDDVNVFIIACVQFNFLTSLNLFNLIYSILQCIFSISKIIIIAFLVNKFRCSFIYQFSNHLYLHANINSSLK